MAAKVALSNRHFEIEEDGMRQLGGRQRKERLRAACPGHRWPGHAARSQLSLPGFPDDFQPPGRVRDV